MSLRLYDTASRQTRDFTPRREGHVGIYLCGATVQAPPHVGHIRSGVSFDVLRRWLEYRDYTVTFVRNVTDIDDKILQRGLRRFIHPIPRYQKYRNSGSKAASQLVISAFFQAMRKLPPSGLSR